MVVGREDHHRKELYERRGKEGAMDAMKRVPLVMDPIKACQLQRTGSTTGTPQPATKHLIVRAQLHSSRHSSCNERDGDEGLDDPTMAFHAPYVRYAGAVSCFPDLALGSSNLHEPISRLCNMCSEVNQELLQ